MIDHPAPMAHERRSEEAFTLIEMAVTMLLLGMVLAMLLQAMVMVQNSVDREAGRNTRNDRLQLAIFSLERQVRSGNVISDPATLNDPTHGIVPGMAVRVYTQADVPASHDERCVEWRVNGGRLESRDWSPNWQSDGDYSGWRINAEGIRNRDVSPNVPAFFRPPATSYGLRMLQVTLVSDGQGASGGGHERDVQKITTSITGRNTGFPFPGNICDVAPAYP